MTAIAAGGAVALTSPAQAADTDIKINEVESNGDSVADWVELKNTGTTAVDISGFGIIDNDTGHQQIKVPSGTVVQPGGYYAIYTDTPGQTGPVSWGLGANDSVTLYAANGTTQLDTYAWTAHATTTYGRCPDGTGAFTTTGASTRGATNNCGTVVTPPPITPGAAWPGGSTVTTVDPAAAYTSNLSGLYYEASGTSAPGTIWAVRNGGPEALYKLTKSGTQWVDAAGWTGGKQLRYADGTGQPDSEGVTLTDAGPSGGVFVSTERNNAVSGTSRPAILRFDPNASGTELRATNDWNLTSDLPGLGANLGLEGIAWVPDSYLVAKGFKTSAGTAYDPAAYANHGTGLFFVGVEATGTVYAYALNLTGNTWTRVAQFASGFPAVMDLSWEPETQKLWVVCDDTCNGQTKRFDVGSNGAFAAVATYERPTGMDNLNNEGFATAPQAECVGGVKPVFWADDNDTGGFSLRQGTLNCTVPGGTSPTSVVDKTAPSVGIVGAVDGKTYRKKRKPTCSAFDAGSGVASCTVSQQKVGKKKKNGKQKYLVTATATDKAGNSSTVTLTYTVKKKVKKR